MAARVRGDRDTGMLLRDDFSDQTPTTTLRELDDPAELVSVASLQ